MPPKGPAKNGVFPAMRAGQMKENLEALARLGPEAAKRIKQRVSEHTLKTIEEESRVTWLPVDLDIELTEAVYAEIGESGVFEWSRDSLIKSLEGPLLGPLFRGAMKLFGVGPKGAFRFAPRAWKAIFRNCGELSSEEKGPTLLHIQIKDIPAAFSRSRAYLLGIAGSFDAVMVLCRVAGQVSLDTTSVTEHQARFIASWETGPK